MKLPQLNKILIKNIIFQICIYTSLRYTISTSEEKNNKGFIIKLLWKN